MCLASKSELQWNLQQMSDVQPVTLPNPSQIIYSAKWGLREQAAAGCAVPLSVESYGRIGCPAQKVLPSFSTAGDSSAVAALG
jgi:hypothetical protein